MSTPSQQNPAFPLPTSRLRQDWPLPSRMGLIAGEGLLPVYVAENALKMGVEVIPFNISRSNADALKKASGQAPVHIIPGLLQQNLDLLYQAKLDHLVFAGKVNKWILLRNPRLDELALEGLKQVAKRGDDDVMLWMVNGLAERGLQVLPQTLFLENLFLGPGCLTVQQPTPSESNDIAYGFSMAKEMGRLDLGQSVVVSNGMMIAVEAIEGTDECIKRSKKLLKGKSGALVKVAKPNQDQRFDVPTVGLRTLKTMRQAGLNLLAVEANQTLFLDPEQMIAYANRYAMTICCICQSETITQVNDEGRIQ